MIQSKAAKSWTYALLGFSSFVALAPITLMWLTALKTPQEIGGNTLGLPETWQFSNFAEAWNQGGLGSSFRASATVAILTVTLSVVLSLLSGYAFGRFEFQGKRFLFLFLLVGLMLPIEAMIIPLFHMFDQIGLINTYWGLVLPQVAHAVAFGTFWLHAFFINAPDALEDAAAVDGAGPMRILWSVWLPLAKPAVATLAVLLFVWTWNEFLLALVLVQNEAVRTLPVTLSFFQGRYTTDIPLLTAAGTIISLPVLVAYAIFSKRFIEGVATSGAIKG